MSVCCFCFYCVNEMNAGVVEYCGKYEKVVPAGCHLLCWPFQNIVRSVSLRIKQLEVSCETKTKDNVFVKVVVEVQYQVIADKVPSAYYKLSDPAAQIRSYVYDVVRSSIPRLELDHVFASKDDIANAVKSQLSVLMADYGYLIVAALVTDLDPNSFVKASMNDIVAQARLREAASEKADAEKILLVKAAEAEAESKYLSGLGVAKQRKAIVDGLRETICGFSEQVKDAGPSDVMDLLLLTQYFDMIKDVGVKSKTGTTLFLPHGPHSIQDLRTELANNFRGTTGELPKKK